MIETRLAIVAPRTSVPLIRSLIDHSILAANIALVSAIARTPVMAVVKADAFGHGAIEVARTALNSGVDWLGVATVDEALVLRRAGITAPVLAWLVDPLCEIDEAVASAVTVSCADIPTLRRVADAARRAGCRATVHLELDTGMSRGGASVHEWPPLCQEAGSLDDVEIGGIWSHLASASNPGRAGVETQHRRFVDGVAIARRLGIEPRLVHLANSAAALAHPECRFSMVRIGAALYGIETVDGIDFGLRSAIRLTSRVLHVRRVGAGCSVGYNGSYRPTRSTTLALIPAGYADGVPRSLSQGGSVVIGGSRHPIVGSISMDQLVVDVGDMDVCAGDEAVLLGSRDAGEPQPREWADLTGAMTHEILTGLGGRIRREHGRS